MGREDFERVVEEALAGIPDDLAGLIENLAVVVEDEPSDEEIREAGLDPEEDTLLRDLPGHRPSGARRVELRRRASGPDRDLPFASARLLRVPPRAAARDPRHGRPRGRALLRPRRRRPAVGDAGHPPRNGSAGCAAVFSPQVRGAAQPVAVPTAGLGDSPASDAGQQLLRLVRALLPVATLFVGKLIIDEVVELAQPAGRPRSGGGGRAGSSTGWLAPRVSSRCGRLRPPRPGRLAPRLAALRAVTNATSVRLMEHAATLDPRIRGRRTAGPAGTRPPPDHGAHDADGHSSARRRTW